MQTSTSSDSRSCSLICARSWLPVCWTDLEADKKRTGAFTWDGPFLATRARVAKNLEEDLAVVGLNEESGPLDRLDGLGRDLTRFLDAISGGSISCGHPAPTRFNAAEAKSLYCAEDHQELRNTLLLNEACDWLILQQAY
jgi:hypothetical protein